MLDRLHAQTGDILRASYTVRNTSRLPKLWLELRNPSTLPVELPAQAVRLWAAQREVMVGTRATHPPRPLPGRTGAAPHRRSAGHVRVAGLRRKRTRTSSSIRASRHCPAGSYRRRSSRARTPVLCARRTRRRTRPASGRTRRATHTTEFTGRARRATAACRSRSSTSSRPPTFGSSSISSVRSTPGWVTSRRSSTASDWRHRWRHAACSRTATSHSARPAPTSGRCPPTAAPRQYQKIMQTLAAVQADGDAAVRPCACRGRRAAAPRDDGAASSPRRSSATGSEPLGSLRGRGVEVEVILLDAPAFASQERRETGARRTQLRRSSPTEQRAARALRHALAEHDLAWHTILPMEPISGQLITRRDRRLVTARMSAISTAAPRQRPWTDDPRARTSDELPLRAA